jgi:putrescine transport system permease protein
MGVSPEINALATIIVGIVATGVTIAGLIIHHREKRK